MLRVVLDPGVLVSAAIAPRGVCAQILKAALDKQFVIVVCPNLLAELEKVLVRPKFRDYLSIAEARSFVVHIAGIAERLPDPVIHGKLTPDPDDDYLVALAQVGKADHLISGDAHLTNLVLHNLSVLAPRTFLDHLLR